MNKKLIAVAVASAVALPVISAADVTVYGRVNTAIKLNDTDGNSDLDISSVNSRFGVKASSDVGNGLTASGKYEFSTGSDNEVGPNDVRVATVGLSGGFGSVTLGNQWSAFYDTVGTDIDPTYTVGFHLYSGIGSPYRSSNTIKYSNSFGPVYMEADVRLNDSDEDADVAEKINGNGFGLGIRITATDNLTFGVAIDSEEDEMDNGMTYDTDRIGVSSKVTAGNFFAMVGYHENENEMMGGVTSDISHTHLWVGSSIGNTTMMLGYGKVDKGRNHETMSEPSQLALGVYHNLGGGMRLYYEGAAIDKDTMDSNDDITEHYFGMRYDF